MSATAELHSIATVLDELATRITNIAEDLGPAEREALGSELAEVERTLSSARRRLDRALRAAP